MLSSCSNLSVLIAIRSLEQADVLGVDPVDLAGAKGPARPHRNPPDLLPGCLERWGDNGPHQVARREAPDALWPAQRASGKPALVRW